MKLRSLIVHVCAITTQPVRTTRDYVKHIDLEGPFISDGIVAAKFQ